MSEDALAESLDLLARRVGDPTAMIYERVFARFPGTESLFCMDQGGHVRGQMLSIAFEALLDGGGRLEGLIGIERLNHVNIGVPEDAFDGFFPLLLETVRDALGAEWTPAMERGWQARLAALREA